MANIALLAALPRLLPKAIAWVEGQEQQILAHGRALSVGELALARAVQVARPELIRLSLVARLPLPEDPELQAASLATGLLGPGMAGVTFGHGIYVVSDQVTPRLLSHECRHVHQYETAGSIAAFLPVYLEQILRVGYGACPLEVDARNWERDRA
ncbi:MAG TPA: hypothetical protein VMT09_11245 [Steroidobacteraceae bacterium]|nr:hypothetical protein [Steroidobacteraceae bacterium]